MNEKRVGKNKLFFFDNLVRFGGDVLQFVSSRKGGFSKKSFASLNCAFYVGDDKKLVRKNRKKIYFLTGIEKSRKVFMNQTHSDQH